MLAWLYPPARPPGLGRGPQFLATRELSVTGLLPQFAQETSQPWKPGNNFSGGNGGTEPGNDLNKALRETPPSPAILYSPCDAHPSPIGADLVSLEDSRAGTLLASRCGHHELRLLVVRLSGRSRLLGGLPPAPSGRRAKRPALLHQRPHSATPERKSLGLAKMGQAQGQRARRWLRDGERCVRVFVCARATANSRLPAVTCPCLPR